MVNKINQFSYKYQKLNKIKIILCLPNTLIYYFKKKLKSEFISLGAQNCHHRENYGAYTGSVNASMLKKIGAEYIQQLNDRL